MPAAVRGPHVIVLGAKPYAILHIYRKMGYFPAATLVVHDHEGPHSRGRADIKMAIMRQGVFRLSITPTTAVIALWVSVSESTCVRHPRSQSAVSCNVSFLTCLCSSGVIHKLQCFPDYLVPVLGAQVPCARPVAHLADRRLAAFLAVFIPLARLSKRHLV